MYNSSETFRYYLIYYEDIDETKLYAFTNKKKLAEEFIRQRQNSKFILKKKDMSSYEAMNIERIYPTLYLLVFEFSTQDNSDILNVKNGSLILTAKEKSECVSRLSELIFHNIIADCYPIKVNMLHKVTFLKNKYFKSLIDIGYIKINNNRINGVIDGNDIRFNTLEMILTLFAHLFK